MNPSSDTLHPRPILGILGGLGPHAHILLEQRLLDAAQRLAGARRDQDYPEWVVASIPQTPDRTAALEGRAPDPVPHLLAGLRRLEGCPERDVPGVDFVLIPCNTAHAYLDTLRAASPLELLDMIDLTARHLSTQLPAGASVGLLATSGTVRQGIYHRALERHDLVAHSPLDAPNGEALQQRVMDVIYGAGDDPGGLKAHGTAGAAEARGPLLEVAEVLVRQLDCRALLLACTEIPLAIHEDELFGVPSVDPMAVLAEAAVRRVVELDAEVTAETSSPR